MQKTLERYKQKLQIIKLLKKEEATITLQPKLSPSGSWLQQRRISDKNVLSEKVDLEEFTKVT